MTKPSMLGVALEYAQKGYAVFPCAKKKPLTGEGGFKNATRDESQIKEWWTKWPEAQVALPTGRVNHLFVLDLDSQQAQDYAKQWNLPETFTVETRPTRKQKWFLQPDGIETKCTAEVLAPKIDTRGDGGYVIAPPSIHHETRAAYRVVLDLPYADAGLLPAFILRPEAGGKNGNGASPKVTGDKIPRGSHDAELTRIAGKLRRDGMEENLITAALIEVCEKRCEDHGPDYVQMCAKVARSVCRYPIPEAIEAALPEIPVRAGEAPQAADLAEEVLLEHTRRLGIFQRGSELVKIIRIRKARKDSRLDRPSGTLMLEPLTTPVLKDALERIACFVKWDARSKKDVRCDCPERVVVSYLSRRGSWRLPYLFGTIAAPVLRPNGTALIEPGYDEDTELFLESEQVWLPLAENPTQEDARAALEILRAPFAQFPFVSDEDRAVVIAGILTALQRRLLGPSPAFAFSAPQPRSGKTLLAESMAIIALGRAAPASAVSTEEEEFRKALTASLREGHPIINLDNIEKPLRSSALCEIITGEEFKDRLLGETRNLVLPTNCTWTITGNNVAFRGDLAQRVLLCRIDANVPNPEQRKFDIPDFKAHLLEHHAELVKAALTILRAYHIAGRPKQDCPNWGGFEDWSAQIREPLIWAGEVDCFATRETAITEDPEMESAITVLVQLSKIFGEEHFTTKEALDKANDMAIGKPAYPELRSALMAATGSTKDIDARKLAWWIRIWQDRFAGGIKFTRANRKNTNPAQWKIEKGQKSHEES